MPETQIELSIEQRQSIIARFNSIVRDQPELGLLLSDLAQEEGIGIREFTRNLADQVFAGYEYGTLNTHDVQNVNNSQLQQQLSYIDGNGVEQTIITLSNDEMALLTENLATAITAELGQQAEIAATAESQEQGTAPTPSRTPAPQTNESGTQFTIIPRTDITESRDPDAISATPQGEDSGRTTDNLSTGAYSGEQYLSELVNLVAGDGLSSIPASMRRDIAVEIQNKLEDLTLEDVMLDGGTSISIRGQSVPVEVSIDTLRSYLNDMDAVSDEQFDNLFGWNGLDVINEEDFVALFDEDITISELLDGIADMHNRGVDFDNLTLEDFGDALHDNPQTGQAQDTEIAIVLHDGEVDHNDIETPSGRGDTPITPITRG